eukprot:scaffold227754_cov27-Prasinocladus_malaysianus.AAC.1
MPGRTYLFKCGAGNRACDGLSKSISPILSENAKLSAISGQNFSQHTAPIYHIPKIARDKRALCACACMATSWGEFEFEVGELARALI